MQRGARASRAHNYSILLPLLHGSCATRRRPAQSSRVHVAKQAANAIVVLLHLLHYYQQPLSSKPYASPRSHDITRSSAYIACRQFSTSWSDCKIDCEFGDNRCLESFLREYHGSWYDFDCSRNQLRLPHIQASLKPFVRTSPSTRQQRSRSSSRFWCSTTAKSRSIKSY